jgi:hypothetical protein
LELHYKNLLMAFKPFVVINQCNGMAQDCHHKTLVLCVHQVLQNNTHTRSKAHTFLKRILTNFTGNLKAVKGANREDSCIRWTTYKNLSLWFDNWERDLVELGSVYHDLITNKICIPEEQLINILNFNEMCMSLTESTQNCGGRPEMILYDPRFPQVGKGTSKNSTAILVWCKPM